MSRDYQSEWTQLRKASWGECRLIYMMVPLLREIYWFCSCCEYKPVSFRWCLNWAKCIEFTLIGFSSVAKSRVPGYSFIWNVSPHNKTFEFISSLVLVESEMLDWLNCFVICVLRCTRCVQIRPGNFKFRGLGESNCQLFFCVGILAPKLW
jgi:hypothetical protein